MNDDTFDGFDDEIILEDMTEELVDTPLEQLDSSIRDMTEGIDFTKYTPEELRLTPEEVIESAAELVTLFVQTHPEGITNAQARVFLQNEAAILAKGVEIIEMMLEGHKPELRIIH